MIFETAVLPLGMRPGASTAPYTGIAGSKLSLEVKTPED